MKSLTGVISKSLIFMGECVHIRIYALCYEMCCWSLQFGGPSELSNYDTHTQGVSSWGLTFLAC